VQLAPLLRQVRTGMTPFQNARAWPAQVPLPAGLAMAGWLLAKGVLVDHEARGVDDASRLRVPQ